MTIIKNANISHLTTFSIGSLASYLLKPKTKIDCINALKFIKSKNLNYFILGYGSNVLLGSYPYKGAVISTLNLNKLYIKNNQIHAYAGVINSDLANFALKNNFTGFEFLYWMPGSIGGSAVMNSKAFGSSMSDIVLAIDIIDENLVYKRILNKDINYSYKNSIFQTTNHLLVKVILKTQKAENSKIKEKMNHNKNKRLKSKQNDFPSAGCIFKNNYDIGISSGKIIDSLGFKDFEIGFAKVYKYHANFIINCGGANSNDVINLINLIKKKALSKLSVNLECEIKFLGNFNKTENL